MVQNKTGDEWKSELDHFSQIATLRLALIPGKLEFYGGSLQWEEHKTWYRLWGDYERNANGVQNLRRYCFAAIDKLTGNIFNPDSQTGHVDIKRQKFNKGNLFDEDRGTKHITPEGVYCEKVCAYRRWLRNHSNPNFKSTT